MIKKILLVLLLIAVPRAGSQGKGASTGAVPRSAAASTFTSSGSFVDPDIYVARVRDAASGLPGSSVRALAMTADGFLWIGTEAGLARFDGVRFELFDQYNSTALKDSRILSLHEDAGGVLWTGSDGGGLCAVSGGDWRCIGQQEGLRNLHVSAIAGDGAGRLWAGTEYGVHCFDGAKTDLFGLDEGFSNNIITALSIGPGDEGRERIWAGTLWGGLAAIEGDAVQLYDFNDGLEDLSVQSLLATPEGDVWIGTMKGLYRWSIEEKRITSVPGLGDYPVTALCEAPGGILLVGTMVEGLKAVAGPNAVDLFAGGDLADCHVRSILAWPDGQIWAGTESMGLVHLKKRTVTSIGVEDGLPEGSVYAVLEEGSGSLWIGTESSGLCLLREGRVARVIGKEDGLAGKMVRVLSKDDAGRLWVGTMDGGISIVDGRSIRNLTAAGGLPSDNVSEIFFDGGGVWIGTERGLYRGSVDEPLSLSPASGLEGQTVRALYRAGDGALYAGTRGGLWRLLGESFERLGGDALQAEVLSIYMDGAGTIWAGTNGQGLRSISADKVRSFTSRDGLPGNFIFSIVGETGTAAGKNGAAERENGSTEVKKGSAEVENAVSAVERGASLGEKATAEGERGRKLWVSCEAGVFTIDADSLVAYADGKASIIVPTLYDENDGMPTSRCNGYCAPAVCVSGSGIMCYPTNEGLAVFDRKALIASVAAPPKVIIEPLLVDNARLIPVNIDVPVNVDAKRGDKNGAKSGAERSVVFSGRADRVEIRFTAIDWSAPEKCRFLYRLEGYEKDFRAVHPGQPRSAVYSDLPPGEYRFAVRAIGNTGLWSAEAASVSFAVEPPFYGKAGFIAVALCAAALAAGAVVVMTRRRKIRVQKIKYSTSSINDERMDEAAETLRALMEEEKVFLDPDLTLKKLAQRLGIHYNHLSRIINEKHEESFNNFINRHRIDEAKRRLSDPAFREKNILEIMLETGFYSKSTFNTAFKKFTGQSPSEFRKKNG